MKKAVALKYPEGAVAPLIVAKGNNKLAEKIISEAQKNDVQIEENKELIDILYDNEIGSSIPEEAWSSVAVIFSYILGQKHKKAGD